MNLIKLYEKHAYMCIFTLILCAAGGLMCNEVYGMQLNQKLVILLSLFVVLMIRGFDEMKKSMIPYLVLGGIILVITFIILDHKENVLIHIEQYKDWWYGQGEVDLWTAKIYSYITIGIGSILAVIPIYMLQKLFITRVGISILCTIFLIYMALNEAKTSKAGVAFLILYIFIQLLEISLKGQYEKWTINYERVMIYLFPVAFVLVLLFGMLPVSREPIKWSFVKYAWNTMKEFGIDLFDDISLHLLNKTDKDNVFGISFTGYSEDAQEISGGINYLEGTPLFVKVERLRSSNLYLKGNVKNVYTGRGWVEEFTAPEYLAETKEYVIGAYELMYLLYRQGQMNEVESYLSNRKLEVTFHNIKTTSVFYPPFTYSFNIMELNKFMDKNNNLQYEEPREKEHNYNAYYLDLDLANDKVKEMIQNQNHYSYGSLEVVKDFKDAVRSKNLTSISELDYFEDFLSDRADYIEANYLKLPDTLPDRVRELTLSITKDYDTDYEKLRAIEGYLNNFQYTLSPKVVGDRQDLVDSFLFEYKEGFCTYFASAMAVMARTIGIPTRFVQGFLVPVEMNQSKTFMVHNSNAHAWVEAYLEGVGWITFEPTPSYNGGLYTTWVEEQENILTPTIEKTNPYISKDSISEFEKLNKESAIRKQSMKGIVTTLLWICGIGIVSIVSYCIFRIYRYKAVYEKADNNNKVSMDISFLLCLLEKRGMKIELGETLNHYIMRIHHSLQQYIEDDTNELQQLKGIDKNPNKIDLMAATDIYMRLRYHEEEVNDQEQIIVANVVKQLLLATKNELGTWRYLMIYFRLLSIA